MDGDDMTDRDITERQYADRDPARQGEHYTRHVQAMTAEGLHAKSRIAAELAHRDIEIDTLRAEVAQVREYADALNARCIEDTAEIGRLRAEVARLQADGIHSCHDECPRIACVQRREIERLRALLREACDELDPHGTRDGRPVVHQHIIDLQARINAALAGEAER
jgi:chromosome segregation ATPase